MPITVHEIGPDGTLVQTTIGDDAAPPDDAAPAPAVATDTPPASAPDAPAPDPAAPAPEEPAPPDSAPESPVSPETPTEDEDEEATVTLTKGVQRRIDRLTRQREEARRAQAALEERLRMLEQGYQRPAPEPPPPEPTAPPSRREDYATDEEWIQAVTQQVVSREREQWQLEQLRARQREEAQQREAQWATREQQVKAQHPDYDDQVQTLAGRLSPQLWQGLSDSEQAPELAYHLARHPDELRRLNGLQPMALSRALGRLEQQLTAPPPRPAPSPTVKPAPPTPLNGAGSAGPRQLTDLSEADVAAMSQAEFEAAYARQFPKSR